MTSFHCLSAANAAVPSLQWLAVKTTFGAISIPLQYGNTRHVPFTKSKCDDRRMRPPVGFVRTVRHRLGWRLRQQAEA